MGDFNIHLLKYENWVENCKYSQTLLQCMQSFSMLPTINLVTVFDAILTSRQMLEKLQCLYENLKSNNFHRTAVLKKYEL